MCSLTMMIVDDRFIMSLNGHRGNYSPCNASNICQGVNDTQCIIVQCTFEFLVFEMNAICDQILQRAIYDDVVVRYV